MSQDAPPHQSLICAMHSFRRSTSTSWLSCVRVPGCECGQHPVSRARPRNLGPGDHRLLPAPRRIAPPTAQCQVLRPQIDWASLPVPEMGAVPTQAAPTTVVYNINTGGGAFVGGDVSAGVFAGRDQTNSAIASAGAGLRALNQLKAQPDVARLLGGAQADLQNTLDQIVYLGDYKEMHDQLHQLQFDCLAFLVRGADKFPDDADFCETLGGYTDKFGEVVGRLREIGGRPALRRANEELGSANWRRRCSCCAKPSTPQTGPATRAALAARAACSTSTWPASTSCW